MLLGAGVRATREKWSEAEVFLCHVLVLQVRNRCRGGGSRSQAVSAGRWREKLCAGGAARVMVEAWRRSMLGGAGKGARYRGALRGSGWAGGAAECLGQPWGWGCPGGAVGLVAAWGGQQDWASFPQMPLKVLVELELAEGGCRTR